MRWLFVGAIALAGCEEADVADVDAAVDSGDAIVVDTATDTNPIDTGTFDTAPFDTGSGTSCKDLGVPCSPGESCCGSLVCANKMGAFVCSMGF
jgi:hypothetical protein